MQVNAAPLQSRRNQEPGGESFCVWDLRVIWWEAYVTAVLAGRPGGVEAYLTTVAEGYA
jgi:hypothetical protein